MNLVKGKTTVRHKKNDSFFIFLILAHHSFLELGENRQL